MANCDLNRVLCLLRSVYPFVQTVEQFSECVVYKGGRKAVLIEPSDTDGYKELARSTIVCRDKVLQQVPCSNQITTLPELLALVLNGLKKKRKKNVLSLGYVLKRHQKRVSNMLVLQGKVTQSAIYIQGSSLWRKLNERCGTDVTKYLLESCAVFVPVSPSCLFQVCGVPFYDSVPVGTGSWWFLSQPRSSRKPLPHRHRVIGKCGVCGAQQGKRGAKCLCVRRASRKRKRSGSKDGAGEAESGRGPEQKRRRTDWTGDGQMCEEEGPKLAVPSQGTSPAWRTGAFPPPAPHHCFIRTMGLLYGELGLKSFLLNRKVTGGAQGPRRLQGRDLVRLVFFEGVEYMKGVERGPRRLPTRFHRMVTVFGRLLQRHRKCPYTRLLQKTCPVWSSASDLGTLLAQHSVSHQVYMFARECLHRVVPEELWGSAHNRLHFLSQVKGFLRMGKFDRLSLSELLWKMRVSDCDWLKISKTGRCPSSEHRYRERLLGQFLAWLLDGYVLGLLRAVFYVTESAGQKNSLLFYRQQVWQQLQEIAFRKHLSKGQWEPLNQEQVASLPKTTLVSRLRYIPKPGGLRPIVRMVGSDRQTRLFQSRLKDLHDVLRVCVRKQPSLLGSTVFGLQDIHRVLGPFAALQKENPRPLYFVKVDVRGAYDSLPHEKLLQVVSEVLSPVSNTPFSIRHYAQVWTETTTGFKRAFRRQADMGVEAQSSMKGFLMVLQKTKKVHNAIFVEQRFTEDLYGKDVLEFFKQTLDNYVLQFGKESLRQRCGIPQGWVVSMLLCCLCYGDMENALFRHVTEGGGCLLRLVDDFLLITPKLSTAQTFLKTLLAGIPEYGCFANSQKVAVNFPLDSVVEFPELSLLPPSGLFPWCGLLLDTSSLDVYSDYSSYAGRSLRCSLTRGSNPHAGQHMKTKLIGILRLKCQALFLDLNMNSFKAVYQNIYKIVLLQAYRFHACAQNLPFGQTVSRNPPFFAQVIWEMAKVTNLLIRQANRGVFLGSKALGGCLQYEVVELMYCVSFLVTLSQHPGLYSYLLPDLRTRKRYLERRLGALRLALIRRASTPQIPEDFQNILV